MNNAAAIPGNMDIDPLSSYEYPAYDSYAAQSYAYPTKLQQSIYQAYQQTNANYMNNAPPQEPSNPQSTIQTQHTFDIDIQLKTEPPETEPKKVLKRRRKEKNGQKSTYCSEKITDASFKFYGCSVCNISYNALHELDQHVTVHKNRMTSYRLRLKNQIKKKQLKKEKKKLKKMVKMVKQEFTCDVEIKPEDGYIGEEKAADFMSNGTNSNMELNTNVNNGIVPNSECNRTNATTELNTNVNNGIVPDSECNGTNPTTEINTNMNNGIVPDSECNGTNSTTELNTNVNNGIIPDSECNRMNPTLDYNNPNIDRQNSVTQSQSSHINTNTDFNSITNDPQSHDPNSLADVNSTVENVNSKDKENSMDEAELGDLAKIYKCFACQKQFTLSYYLKLHVRSHTDEKPYTCSACGQSFITASKLGRHNKRIHLAERYQCRICFKIYSRFELLTAHFDKTHPEDKLDGEPYDYNAILPYLKELEEQLRAPEQDSTIQPVFKIEQDSTLEVKKLEGDSQLEQDEKPKAEELFWEAQVGPHLHGTRRGEPPIDIKEEVLDEDQKDFVPKIDILIEEVTVDFDVPVKRERTSEEPAADVKDDGDDGVDGDDGGQVKDEDSLSDEDYFPSNTWIAPRAPSPSLPTPTPPAAPRRRGAPLECEVCNKRISSASYMRVHLRTHSGERPFKCRQCGRGFITSSKMHRHVLTHAQDKDSVKTEGEEVKTELDTEATEQPPEDGAKKPVKKKSKMKLKSKSAKLKPGEEKPRRKHQKRPHACEYCNQKFLHLNMLEVHKQSHAGEALVLRCHYCLQDAADEASLREHQATHQGPKPYLCTVCGNTYKKRETMVYHRKRHLPDKEFECDVCAKRFNAACKLSKHLVTHRADKFVLRYECPVCAHMFNTQYHVQMHLRTHQKEGLILEENRSEILAMVLQNARKIPKQASAPFAQASAPLAQASVPPDERSRVCNICGELFHHFYYLEEHLKTHASTIAITDTEKEDEKKYICEICNKGFKLHYYLKLHSFTHSKEKPFICQQCGKGFITKGKLKRHLETHTGLKKYQCHICYKFFTRPSYLRIHIRTIHGTQDYNFRFDKGYGMDSMAMSAMTMSDVSQNSI